MRNRLLSWGIALTAARIAAGLISLIDGVYIPIPVIVVGTALTVWITQRRGALWTFPLWYAVYGATRVVMRGQYGGPELAWGAVGYYWGSMIVALVILSLGCVSALRARY
jgi:hypothetical protein